MTDRFEAFRLTDVRFPTSREAHGSDAMNRDPDYSAAYLELPTTAGDSGFGFVFTIGRGTEVQVAAIAALEHHVVGRDVPSVLADLGGMWRELVGDTQLRWLGPDKGVEHMAVGAVINALWDLRARRTGVPLWELLCALDPSEVIDLVDFTYLRDALTPDEAREILLRGRSGADERTTALLSDGLPAYTTSAGWLGYSDDKVVTLAKQAVADGFDHLKIKVGLDLDHDLHRLDLVRSTVGPDIKLSIDANQRWGVAEAIESVNRLAPAGLWWVEEPTSPDDVLGHAAVRAAVQPVLVATGEHAANRVIMKQLLAGNAIDVCQIDACRVAGVNENIAVILMAAKFGVPVCPHAGGVGLCEIVQHLAIFDAIAITGPVANRWIEYVDHLHEHFETPVVIRGGRYLAPRAPGSGARMHPESAIRYRYPGTA
jgi:L-fuconate dehydratase